MNFKEAYQRKPRFWQAILFILAALILIHFFVMHAGKIHKPGVPVVLAPVKSANVPVYFEALGTVTPLYSVTVRTQINGKLLQVYFQEGQIVTAGQLLASIDSRTYQAQLMQYQGQYARDMALLQNAILDLQRYQKLWRQNSISKQTLDTQAALVQQDQGIVRMDWGLIQATEVNLSNCQITSPLNGRIGLRLVDPGNYVQTSDTNGLVVINMVNPITVLFTLPEDDIPAILKEINAGKKLSVYAYDRLENTLLAVGTLLTMDNQVDPTTGTVKLKAIFNNNTNILFPNQFVNIKLLVKTLTNATILPTEAIQHGTDGSFVYQAEDETANIKPVTTTLSLNGTTVITQGVTPGKWVVVEGADKLTDGAEIHPANTITTNNIKISHQKHRWRFFL